MKLTEADLYPFKCPICRWALHWVYLDSLGLEERESIERGAFYTVFTEVWRGNQMLFHSMIDPSEVHPVIIWCGNRFCSIAGLFEVER